MIRFHRGEIAGARHSFTAAGPHAQRIGAQVIGRLALAYSLDYEHAGAPIEALTILAGGITANAEELDEIEVLLPDAVHLACQTGDLDTARTLEGHTAALAAGSEIPHRQANALYCRSLLEYDTAGLLAAADCYHDAARPVLSAKTLEVAAEEFLKVGDHDRARAAFSRYAPSRCGTLRSYEARD
jgi:hypothetical protein